MCFEHENKEPVRTISPAIPKSEGEPNVGTTCPMFDTFTRDPGDIILIIKRDPLSMFFYSEHKEVKLGSLQKSLTVPFLNFSWETTCLADLLALRLWAVNLTCFEVRWKL